MADIKKIKIGSDELDLTKKQDKIDSSHKLSADLVDDSSTTNKFTTSSDISKLAGIESGAEVNVQSDWNQTTDTADDYIKNKPSLATVATSGSYNDLSNKPTIPTVNNATLTIQKNGTTVKTFTANASSDVTANITVPTKTSDLTNDGSDGASTYVEADNLATVATSGSYSDLSNKPTIGNATITIQKNGTSAGIFTTNATSNKSINITVPTTASDVSALPDSTKYGASILLTIDDEYKAVSNPTGNPKSQGWFERSGTSPNYVYTLTNDTSVVSGKTYYTAPTWVITQTLKDQDGNVLGSAQSIDLPLESVVVSGRYDSQTKEVVLTLEDGSEIKFSVADLVSGLQTEITSSNKLSSDLVDDTNNSHKFMTSSEKTKLSGIETGAEVNVQSDWTQTTTTADDYIKNKPELATIATSGSYNDLSNKPTIPTVNNATLTITQNGTSVGTFTANASSNKTIEVTDTIYSDATTSASGLMSSSDKTKLNGIATGAEVNVQSDWNQTTTTADDYIKNKPTLATVATSGSYNDLSNKPTIPTVNNATLTIQKNGTTVKTFTANASSNVTANITVPTNNNELTNGAGYITSSGSITGNAATATKLAAGKTIAIGTGATGTATSFDGSANITIPVTDVKEAYATWGGTNKVGDITPDDMGCTDEFGHNKLAYLPASCINVAYSTDGGSTWTDYGATDAEKVKMVTTSGPGFGIGKSTEATSSNITNLKLRIRLACGTTGGAAKLYTAAKKILFNVSTQGAASKVHMRYRTIANYMAGTETWTDISTEYTVAGGSGWNSIPFAYTFGGNMSTQTGQIGEFEFVFSSTALGTWGGKKLVVYDIRLIGSTNWIMPSEMARAGRLYTVDEGQNATFPANVSVTGSLKHGSYTYTLPNKTGTVAMTSDLPTVNNATLTIQKNGTNVQTFTANQSTNATANITVPTKISDLSNTSGGFITYCTCSTAAATAAKVVALDSGDSNWALRKGAIIGVKFTNTNTASSVTLNVNSSGAKSIYYNNAAYTGSSNSICGYANRYTFYMYDGTYWVWISDSRHDGNDNTYTTAYCSTAAGTAAKAASMTGYTLTANRYTVITFTNANSSASALTLNINSKGAKPLYINGAASSASNYTLAAGSYIVYYDGTNYYINNNGEIPRMIHSESPVSTSSVTPIITNGMISDGTIEFSKTKAGDFVQLTMSTTDISVGSALAKNTLYGVYSA